MTLLTNPQYQIDTQSINPDGSLGEYYKRYTENGKTTFPVMVADGQMRESAIFALQENGKVNPAKLVFVYEENGKLRVTTADSTHAEVQVFCGDNFIDALEMNAISIYASPAPDSTTELFDRSGGHAFRPVAGFAHPLLHQINLDADLQTSHKTTCPSGNISGISKITPLAKVCGPVKSDAEILATQIARRTR